MAGDIRILNGNAAGRRILPDEDMTFRLLHMRPGDPGYTENRKLFRENYTQIGRRLIPKAVAAFGELDGGKKVLCLVMTLGEVISDYIDSRFAGQEYEQGLLFSSMADSALFAFEEQLLPQIRRIVNEKGYGICARMEIPDEITADDVRRALELSDAERILGVTGTKEGMLHPVKSMCMIYALTEDADVFLAGHDCVSCASVDCRMKAGRTDEDAGMRRMTIPAGVGVMDFLRSRGVCLASPCGGRGVCGKCGVRLVRGTLAIHPSDSVCYTQEQLRSGWRLACLAETTEEIEILYRAGEEAFSVQTDAAEGYAKKHPEKKTEKVVDPDREQPKAGNANSGEDLLPRRGRNNDGADAPELGIAIDLGTTTLAASLVDLSRAEILGSAAGINHQRTYGADVISRIRAAGEGRGAQMQELIRRDLAGLIRELAEAEDGNICTDSGRESAQGTGRTGETEEKHVPTGGAGNSGRIRRIVIAGNTTMEHLLLGYPTEGLGRWPFRPVSLGGERRSAEVLFGPAFSEMTGVDAATPVDILPGCSAYIGADIASGMMCAGMSGDNRKEIILFVDLGTNGEMAVGDGTRILAASTAAGPALEGGALSCGTGSIPGAVCRVRWDGTRPAPSFAVETIGGAEPVGICGTGAIEALAAFLDAGIMDRYGTLVEPYFSEGVRLAKRKDGTKIVLTQADVREIQMAKSAIRAGIGILLTRFGTSIDRIDQVILAGGFGFQLDPAKAARIGLLPVEAEEKTVAAGNTSLAGAVRVLTEKGSRGRMLDAIARTEEVILGNDEEFRDCYIRYMNFEGEGQDDEE
uniref:ASKHA domain-containing protein n=1 Tax=Eubacterium cellulosolvens TaxID=29322 RepID=UPI00068547F6|nr:ASKHA domain-containing protein [[Eubacterium] cellulosolvens]